MAYINPAVLFPSMPASELTRTGLYNSGLIEPAPGAGWSVQIGDVTPGQLRYICLLHDASGMWGTLVVLPH